MNILDFYLLIECVTFCFICKIQIFIKNKEQGLTKRSKCLVKKKTVKIKGITRFSVFHLFCCTCTTNPYYPFLETFILFFTIRREHRKLRLKKNKQLKRFL